MRLLGLDLGGRQIRNALAQQDFNGADLAGGQFGLEQASARGAKTGRCCSAHCAGLLPGVQITVGSAVASSGSARISAAIHPGPVQAELRPHSDASART